MDLIMNDIEFRVEILRSDYLRRLKKVENCQRGLRVAAKLVRQGGDPTVASSSIALLQERFRQLQKVRENRKKKELLKLLSESEHTTTPHRQLSFQPEMVLSHQSDNTAPESLSLGLNSPGRHVGLQAMRIPTSTGFWPSDAAGAGTSTHQENSDVDTSLHL